MYSKTIKISDTIEEIWVKNRKRHRKKGPASISNKGSKIWYYKGQLHRAYDKPAIEYADGNRQWWRHGKRHRQNGPALINAQGKYWYLNNVLDREDGPAIEYTNGDIQWWSDGSQYVFQKTDNVSETYKETELARPVNIMKQIYQFGERYKLHSFKNRPSVVYENGTKEWHSEGILHRWNLPAIEYANGDKEYWHYGLRHRENGPAVIYGNKEYWYKNGELIK
jgi:hypothetical protein